MKFSRIIICNIFIDENGKPNFINIINKIEEDLLSYVNDNFKYMVEADEIDFDDNIKKNKIYKSILKITSKYELYSQYGDNYNEAWELIFLRNDEDKGNNL